MVGGCGWWVFLWVPGSCSSWCGRGEEWSVHMWDLGPWHQRLCIIQSLTLSYNPIHLPVLLPLLWGRTFVFAAPHPSYDHTHQGKEQSSSHSPQGCPEGCAALFSCTSYSTASGYYWAVSASLTANAVVETMLNRALALGARYGCGCVEWGCGSHFCVGSVRMMCCVTSTFV